MDHDTLDDPTGIPLPVGPRPLGPDRLPPTPPYGDPLPPVRPLAPTSPSPEPPRKSRTLLTGFLAGVAGAVTVAVLLLAVGLPTRTAAPAGEAAPATTAPPVTVVEPVVPQIAAPTDPSIVEAVAAKVVPSVVTVDVGSLATDGTFEAFASGSGVVIRSDGYLVTNEHVVSDAEAVRVIFQDGRIYEATIVGSDTLTDLAVLRIDADPLVAVEFGSTADLSLGSPAIAVGNPLGQRGGASVTAGVISAFGREVDFGSGKALFGMLQTDAPITRGSSGGALVDERGRLIGITTAIGVSDAGAEGIGYATPVELVRRIADELIETGQVRHAFLGVSGTDHLVETDDGALVPDGAEIVELAGEDTAAAVAGLRPGDVIVRFGGTEVRTMNDLVLAVRLYRVGDEVEFEVRRDGASFTTRAVLGERPPDA